MKVSKIFKFFWGKVFSKGVAYLASVIAINYFPAIFKIDRWWYVFPFFDTPMVLASAEIYYVVYFLFVAILGFLIQELINFLFSIFIQGANGV